MRRNGRKTAKSLCIGHKNNCQIRNKISYGALYLLFLWPYQPPTFPPRPEWTYFKSVLFWLELRVMRFTNKTRVFALLLQLHTYTHTHIHLTTKCRKNGAELQAWNSIAFLYLFLTSNPLEYNQCYKIIAEAVPILTSFKWEPLYSNKATTTITTNIDHVLFFCVICVLIFHLLLI